MTGPVNRSASYICNACRYQRVSIAPRLSIFSRVETIKGFTDRSHVQRRPASTRAGPPSQVRPSKPPAPTSRPKPQTKAQSHDRTVLADQSISPVSINTADVTETLNQLRREIATIAASEEVPDQTKVLEILDQSYQISNVLVFGQALAPEEQQKPAATDLDTSLFSDLEEPLSSSASAAKFSASSGSLPKTKMNTASKERTAEDVCRLVYTLAKDAKVDVNKDVLSIYVRIICQLGRPEYLPEIFFLYANKPIPKPKTSPPVYQNPKPNAADNAVPMELSDVALDAAILQRDLPLAIAIIDTTVAARAFRRNKFIKKASLPLAAAGSTPLLAWAGAEWVAQWQNTFDPAMSKYMTMMGAMAYIGTLGTIGFIALTTWNDHHERVVWTPGTPLRERWSREEERLYFDRIAVAWGFQSRIRRGEEMGEEWEALREVLGERSMILDKSDLLEGMQ